MARDERIVLTDILETLKQILDVQKKILNNTKEIIKIYLNKKKNF